MLGRFLPAIRVVTEPATVTEPAPPPHAEAYRAMEDPRSPMLVEALARLEVATRQRNAGAAQRILAEIAGHEDGQWLLRQCVAAGLQDVAAQLASPHGAVIGPAA